ncbi:peptide ABC transporter substrate-binding protein [Paenibacillus sp. CC-CFT747]|nr:peptide ABC transporter substrate-binding protein [Paenibacillus sp. CC-CFT747]
MKVYKVLTTAVVVSMLGSVVAACGKSDSASPSTSPSSGSNSSAPAAKQEIKINFTAEPPALDNSKATTNASFTMLNAMNEGLYRLDKDGKPVAGLAKDMPKISDDKLTYTITLRDNLTWSDGSPLKASDFVSSFQRTLDPGTKAQYAFMVAWLKGGEALLGAKTPDEIKAKKAELGVKAVDDKTIEIKLEKPVAFFTQLLAFPLFFPQKTDEVTKQGESYGKDADKVTGAGPYILKEWAHEQRLVFEKNPKYWDAANVKLEKITMNIVKDRAGAVNLFETKEADLTEINGDFVKQYEGKPEYTIKKELTNAYLMFEQKKAPFLANKNIRQALTMAIDRKAHIATVLKNGSVESTGLVPAGTSDGNNGDFRKLSGDIQPKYDPAKAKELLAKGLQELGMTQLPSFKLTSDDTEGAKKSLEFILAQWKQNLGVTAVADAVPHELRVDRQHKKDYEAIIALWGADYNDPMTFLDMWTTTSEFNETDWSNAQYDALIKKAETEKDPATRAKQLADAEKILMDEMPVGPLYFRSKVYAKRTNIEGLFFPSFGPEFELKWVSIK